MTTLSMTDLLVSTAARGFILLVCTEMVLLALRRRRASAAQKHLVLLTGLVLLLALPLLSLILPPRTISEPPPAVAPKAISEASLTAPAFAMLISADQSNPNILTHSASATTGNAYAAATNRVRLPSPAGASNLMNREWRFFRGGLSLIYFLGVALFALRFALAYIGLHRIASRCYLSVADPVWLARVRSLAGTQGGARNIRLRQALDSHQAPFSTPVTYGIAHPTLLLPSGTIEGQWATSCTDAVLRHEIAHVQRADWAAQVLANAACVLYWFNPWVWQQAHRMNAAAEAACDDRALQAGIDATEYAEHLLFVARAARGYREPLHPVWANLWRRNTVLEMAAKSQASLEERLSQVLAQHRNRSSVPARTLLAVVAFGLLVVAPAAAVRRTVPENEYSLALPAENNGEAIALMQRVQEATLRLRSMTADFTYTEKTVATTGEWATRLGKGGQSISGRVDMMRPNYARVRFSHLVKPAFPNLIASDGTNVYTFTPSSFRAPRSFADGGFDPRLEAKQASGEIGGGGKITSTPASPNGENVHLWDAAPVQAFFDPANAVKNWIFSRDDLSDLHYEGRTVVNGEPYQVLAHYLSGNTTTGHGRPYRQHLFIGRDNLIHGYLLEYVCESKPAFQVAWLTNIKANLPMQPADFAFTPPTTVK